MVLPNFGNLEQGLPAWLKATLVHPTGGTIGAGTEFQAIDETRWDAFVRTTLLDSPDDGLTRVWIFDIDVFAPTHTIGYALGEQTHAELDAARTARRIGGIVIDDLQTVSGPKRVPWDNVKIRRFLSRYRISTRR